MGVLRLPEAVVERIGLPPKVRDVTWSYESGSHIVTARGYGEDVQFIIAHFDQTIYEPTHCSKLDATGTRFKVARWFEDERAALLVPLKWVSAAASRSGSDELGINTAIRVGLTRWRRLCRRLLAVNVNEPGDPTQAKRAK